MPRHSRFSLSRISVNRSRLDSLAATPRLYALCGSRLAETNRGACPPAEIMRNSAAIRSRVHSMKRPPAPPRGPPRTITAGSTASDRRASANPSASADRLTRSRSASTPVPASATIRDAVSDSTRPPVASLTAARAMSSCAARPIASRTKPCDEHNGLRCPATPHAQRGPSSTTCQCPIRPACPCAPRRVRGC